MSEITFTKYVRSQKIWQPNKLNLVGASEPKDLNRIANRYLCLREIYLSFSNNYII